MHLGIWQYLAILRTLGPALFLRTQINFAQGLSMNWGIAERIS